MRAFVVFAVVILGFLTAPSMAGSEQRSISEQVTLEHGGGCRKSSPPGRCCHMDNSTGTVHCH
jgi:hypothetical protein